MRQKGRVGIIDSSWHWPENIVPYTINPIFNAPQVAHILKGMKEIEAVTCVKFVPRTTERDYLEVTV